MKLIKFSTITLAAVAITACNDVNTAYYQGGTLTEEQLGDVNNAIPERAEALFTGMFAMMGEPNGCLGGSRPDDYGFIMMAMSNDLEGPDAWMDDNDYNWFSTCGEWSSRNANYANPYIRYIAPYKQMKIANDVLRNYPEDLTNPNNTNHRAQARAIRAFDLMSLAYAFQFNYVDHMDDPCIPIVTEHTLDAANNPRATVKEVYEQILEDLNYACDHLENYKPSNKNEVSGAVAYGLRARAYLAMEEWKKAADDATKAIELSGCQPASIADLQKPAFYDIEDKNWLWGVDMTTKMANTYPWATCCSWIVSFSADSYSAGTGTYVHINKLLYDKISSTDVRKGWWLDENLHSDNLSQCSWGGATGDDIALLEIDDVKFKMDKYTNVKFGMYSGIGSEINDNDWPLMRVEEMILIKAEGLIKSGDNSGMSVLENFVKTYRDPSYDLNSKLANAIDPTEGLNNEIWFQRRVELWGEGFGMSDIMRLKKPIVRFHSANDPYPAAFQFNVEYGDPYTLLRFPQTEKDNNKAIVDNQGGSKPSAGMNPNLRDGVTD